MKTKYLLPLLLCVAGTIAPAPPAFPNYNGPEPVGTQGIQVARILITAKCSRCDSTNLRIVQVQVHDVVQGGKAQSWADFDWKCRNCGTKWSKHEVLK